MLKLVYIFIVSLSIFSQDIALTNTSENQIGLQGYDPVAYFTLNKAVKGNEYRLFMHNSINYHFSSDAHLKLFKANPEAYLPQYGGFCAYGCSGTKETTGFVADRFPVDPETFKLIDGKLYLFYHKDGYNALDKWNQLSEKNSLKDANKFWKMISE